MRIWNTACLLMALTNFATSADWPHWRGPFQNGTTLETGLVSDWSKDGQHQLWRTDFVGRSTPVVLSGRVYAIGRTGKDITEQEQITCFDANTGQLLWEHKFNVFHTTIPFNRVGWASPVGDTETGNIYVHGVQGMFYCFNAEGQILWSHSLTEEFGRISGYGGRTHTPFVDGNLVIISYLSTSWGSQVPTRHRYFAFDKNNGETIWVSTPGGPPKDTTYSVPVVTEINGLRLLVAGNADGSIYAMDIRTGEKVWGFALSKQRGLNVSVVADGHLIYASHSEENIDNTVMGRVVCIDGRGSGNITRTHEVWRLDGCMAGYSSPALSQDQLYVVDNSANLYCINATTGRQLWIQNIGTVGKGSPVWADGKIYVTEVNGHFHILQVGPSGAKIVSTVQLSIKESVEEDGKTRPERNAEIYGSPAVADGRIYFATEEGIYCLGQDDPSSPALQLIPAEVVMQPGEELDFKLTTSGHGNVVTWSSSGLAGEIAEGKLVVNPQATGHAGTISAAVSQSKATARVRVISPLPWEEDFETVAVEKIPTHWIGASGKFFVRQEGDNKILVKPPAKRGLNRSVVFLGPPTMNGYTIQIDLKGTRNKRRLPDIGLVANRYILDLQGIHQRLQVRSWSSDLRMAAHIDFKWEVDVWYTMKMKVMIEEAQAIVQGKVWKRSESEPSNWNIEVRDPIPNRTGSPGIYGYSAAEIHYDNLKVENSNSTVLKGAE